jgi:hypothetical protein
MCGLLFRRLAAAVVVACLGLATAGAIDRDPLLLARQSQDFEVQPVFDTPILHDLPPEMSLAVSRLTLRPGATFDFAYPGPVAVYVESGSLALQESRTLAPNVLTYSGPLPAPRLKSDKRDVVLPPGYAVFAEDGAVAPIRNPGTEQTLLLVLNVIPHHPGDYEVATSEATAVPAP